MPKLNTRNCSLYFPECMRKKFTGFCQLLRDAHKIKYVSFFLIHGVQLRLVQAMLGAGTERARKLALSWQTRWMGGSHIAEHSWWFPLTRRPLWRRICTHNHSQPDGPLLVPNKLLHHQSRYGQFFSLFHFERYDTIRDAILTQVSRSICTAHNNQESQWAALSRPWINVFSDVA